MHLYRSFPDRHPLAHVDTMPTRAQSLLLFSAALRVCVVAILCYLFTGDWATANPLPIATLLRQHADQITGIAAGWIAFEFLIFIVRARRAAAPAA